MNQYSQNSSSGQRLDSRVVVVTGASNGIGQAIARAAAAEGAYLMLADIDGEGGERTARDLNGLGSKVLFMPCDVSDPRQVQHLMDQTARHFGHLDVLINNAGIAGDALPAHDLDIEAWDRVIAVNLRGPFLCAKYALPYLLQAGEGMIVNVASTYGLIGAPLAPAYCASKGGVVNLTRQLAVDYGGRVRVNAVCPGYVDTDMGGRRASLPAAEAQAALARREANAARQPIGRQAHADEIARAVLFLASEGSSFMTGSVVTVDGGCTATFNHGAD